MEGPISWDLLEVIIKEVDSLLYRDKDFKHYIIKDSFIEGTIDNFVSHYSEANLKVNFSNCDLEEERGLNFGVPIKAELLRGHKVLRKAIILLEVSCEKQKVFSYKDIFFPK